MKRYPGHFGSRLMLLLVFPLIGGCASYYTHYAMFPAETSGGDTRQVRVSWQSAEYPGWWLASNKATPIRLETQCSERVWRIAELSHENAGDCGGGIRACADPSQDVVAATGKAAGSDDVCIAVQAQEGVSGIADIGARFSLRVSCRPETAMIRRDEDDVNVDYLRPSTVPYIVHARKVPRGTLDARLPKFSQLECLED